MNDVIGTVVLTASVLKQVGVLSANQDTSVQGSELMFIKSILYGCLINSLGVSYMVPILQIMKQLQS